MEPNVSLPSPSPERNRSQGPESSRAFERAVEKPEQIEAQESHETSMAPPPASPAPPPVIPDANPIQMPAPVASQPLQPLMSDTPLAAADDDLIEKEWVDKAKKIVLETKDNPFNQEERVSQLQADYLKKRYGKDVKLTSS